MGKLLEILSALVNWLERVREKREAKRHEKNVRDLQDDPGDWFDGHFNGVRDVPDDAGRSGKASTSDPRKDD